jgi:hypothetical protein
LQLDEKIWGLKDEIERLNGAIVEEHDKKIQAELGNIMRAII